MNDKIIGMAAGSVIRIEAMLKTNQESMASILAMLNKTDIKEEEAKLIRSTNLHLESLSKSALDELP